MEKVKISAVSYLNSIPFIYGIEQNKSLLNNIELSKDIPSECARKLITNEVTIGLIPVATILELTQYNIITDFCIGAVGKVNSVLLVSDVPLNQIESIYLDYQSRTSVKLCKVLCNSFWNINVKFLPTKKGYEKKINSKSAGVIIGDRTFNLPKKYNYVYDLSEEWMKWKKLPFVFAAWVSNKALPTAFINRFNDALKFGLNNKSNSLKHHNHTNLSHIKQLEYVEQHISYDFDDLKRKSLDIFLEEIRKLETAF